jgi:T5SS/PEP-CTERM-associated repeat protein
MQVVGSQGARCNLLLTGLVCSVCCIASVHAQLVADGTTNFLDGVSTNLIGDVTVGQSGSFTLLVLTNSAAVTNTGYANIGYISDAHSNGVVVRAGSVWNSGITVVGRDGSFNQLLVLDGGMVSDNSGFIGLNAKAGTNLVLISGAGSLWTNANGVTVGQNNFGNQLVVTNGGKVAGGVANIGLGGMANFATVTDTGSVWSCSSMALGSLVASFNHGLVIKNGGSVSNSGACTIGNYSQNNLLLVTDPGSTFWNGSSILLGYSGRGNQLVVSNGATVTASYTYVEDNAGSQDTLTITGHGSLLTNQTEFHLGHVGRSNLLFVADGGTLADNIGYIGNSSLPGNRALITDPNSIWTNRSDFYVGYFGPQNQLIISNGASVFDSTGYIGYNASATGNTVVITGAGSLWTNRSALNVGSSGPYNQLILTNGGAVVSGYTYVGNGSTGSSNRIVIADPGSVWNTLINFTLGFNMSGGNQLTVSNDATLQAYGLTIGSPSPSAIGNTLTVDGGNIIITNLFSGSTLLMGYSATLNLNSGLIRADSFSSDVGQNTFNFRGGTLQTRGTFAGFMGSIPLVVGDGTHSATFELLYPSSGSHRFNYGLVISSNATLKGAGTIFGNVTISAGGTLSPGSSIGQIVLNGNLVLNNGSTNVMELNATNGKCDSLVGMTNLTYGGTLLLTNIAGALVDGSSFRLFTASNYSGAFGTIVPISPGPGLKWNTNELKVDGVLRVFSLQTAPPSIVGVQSAGSNLQIVASGGISYDPCYLLTTTNISSPTSWEVLNTNVFDAAGNTTFTPSVLPGEIARFFRLQVN